MNLVMGQYKKNNTIIHRLDPRLKLYFLILYIVLVLFFNNIAPMILSILVGCGVIYLSKINILSMLKSIHGFLLVIIFFTVVSAVTFSSISPLLLGIRLIMIMAVSTVFSMTTKPYHMLDALRQGLHLSEELSMTIAIAFGFLPGLSNEVDRIRTAAASRGVDMSEAGFFVKIRDFIPLVGPLFRISIAKAGKLSDAMDIRNYDADTEKTRVYELVFKNRDRLAAILVAVYVALVIILQILI